jgi:hypothetical protein
MLATLTRNSVHFYFHFHFRFYCSKLLESQSMTTIPLMANLTFSSLFESILHLNFIKTVVFYDIILILVVALTESFDLLFSHLEILQTLERFRPCRLTRVPLAILI